METMVKTISCTNPPIMFNGWKHHLGFLAGAVRKWAAKPEQLFPLFVAKTKTLGESQFDLYTGGMTPDEIAHDIVNTLLGFKAYEKEDYFRWIDSSNQLFWQITVSDGSEWILRKNEDHDSAYIHLHPAHHSRLTRRMKGNHLRTAISTLIMANMRNDKPGLPLMNEVRQNYLGLSKISKPMAREIFATLIFFSKEAGLPS